MPAKGYPQPDIHTIETMGVILGGTFWGLEGNHKILQNLTDTAPSSPFFGRRGAQGNHVKKTYASNSNRGANRRRDRFAEALDIRRVLSFDHDPRQRFCAGVTQYDPSVAAEG